VVGLPDGLAASGVVAKGLPVAGVGTVDGQASAA